MSNVPDDWDMYWTTCSNGHRFHMSENYCDRCEDLYEQDKQNEHQEENTEEDQE